MFRLLHCVALFTYVLRTSVECGEFSDTSCSKVDGRKRLSQWCPKALYKNKLFEASGPGLTAIFAVPRGCMLHGPSPTFGDSVAYKPSLRVRAEAL